MLVLHSVGAAGDAGRGGHVGERAVAVVAEQDVRAERGDVEIEIAVVVVVADRDAGLVGRGRRLRRRRRPWR